MHCIAFRIFHKVVRTPAGSLGSPVYFCRIAVRLDTSAKILLTLRKWALKILFGEDCDYHSRIDCNRRIIDSIETTALMGVAECVSLLVDASTDLQKQLRVVSALALLKSDLSQLNSANKN